jgi:CheY-like chemotaxis protein
MAYQVSSKAKETSRSQIAREEKSGNLSVMVGDLDRLMRQYSDIGERPEMRDLFLWLESIRRTARDYAKPQPSRSLSAPSRPEKTLGIGDIIDRAIEKVAYQQGNGFKFDYHRQGEIPAPSIPPDQFEKSILEFLTAALFNAGAAGSLKLETRNENRSLIFELQGNRLAEPPRPADRPEWLRRINGRLEARRVENDQGQTHDTWRLYIPLESGAEESGSPNEPLKILAIDSQDIIRDLLTSMLDSLGHDSKVVGTADEAGLLFRDAANSGQPYAIIIADHSLEKTSGLQLARDFKAQNPNLLFILLSGWGLALDPDEAARMGVDFVLDKPFRLEQLAEAIRTVRNTAA